MRGGALGLLARMAKQVAGRIRGLLRRGRREPERDGAERDAVTSYSLPARRPNEPPYASLRQ